MKSKAIIGILIAIFAGAGVTGLGLWYFHYRTPVEEVAAFDPCEGCPSAKSGGCKSVALENKIVVYYFHNSQRSDSSLKAEKYTKEVLNESYAAALRSGKLELQVINTDSTDMKLFMQNYSLPSTALFVMEYKDNQPTRWRTCDKIWLLVNNEESFRNYVIREVRGYLGV